MANQPDINLSQRQVQLLNSINQLLASPVSVNVSKINGVTVLMGNGITGTGSQRVTIASDNTPFPIKIDQTTLGTTNGVSLVAHSLSNGAPTTFRSLTQTNGTGVSVKASTGNLYGWNIINLHSATIYLKFYNVASPTSASTPVLTLPIVANGNIYQEPNCIQHNFSSVIAIRCVTGSADNDDTAAATLPIIELKYA